MRPSPLYNLAVMLAAVVATLLLLTACKTTSLPSASTTLTGNALAGADVLIQGIMGDVEQAKPHADSIGKAHLMRAGDDAAKVAVKINDAESSNVAAAKELSRIQVKVERQDERLTGYHDQWIGDRTWRYVHWIIGISLLGIVAANVLSYLFVAVWPMGALGVMGRWMIQSLPLMNVAASLLRSKKDDGLIVKYTAAGPGT